jgi:hypothetical protein
MHYTPRMVSRRPDLMVSTEEWKLRGHIYGVLYDDTNLVSSSNHRIGHLYCNRISRWYIERNHVTFIMFSSKLNSSACIYALEWLSQFKMRSGWNVEHFVYNTNLFTVLSINNTNHFLTMHWSVTTVLEKAFSYLIILEVQDWKINIWIHIFLKIQSRTSERQACLVTYIKQNACSTD